MLFDDSFSKQPLETLNHGCDFGIYIHIPFCVRRCRYCAFCSSVIRPVPSKAYTDSICREFDIRYQDFDQQTLTTLYFGGGTPSMIEDCDIERLIAHIESHFAHPSEITLEANPEHVTTERARRWKSFGITRISLGIQSFSDTMLAMLGRHHTGAQAINAITCLQQAGINEISIDLIYGAHLPEMSTDADEIAHWKNDLTRAKETSVPHVSCYGLTLEENTPLWTAQKRGQKILCSETASLEMMRMIPDELGMMAYEISNYSRDHYYSRHNLSCWAGIPYLGLGPGAHSLSLANGKITRQANICNVREWLASSTLPAPAFAETLSPQTHLAERLMCAARTRFCWTPLKIADTLNTSLTPFLPCLDNALKNGLIQKNPDGTYQTTLKGFELNNQLDQILFDF